MLVGRGATWRPPGTSSFLVAAPKRGRPSRKKPTVSFSGARTRDDARAVTVRCRIWQRGRDVGRGQTASAPAMISRLCPRMMK